jgi:hypothetical protein
MGCRSSLKIWILLLGLDMLRQGANFDPIREQITSSFRPINSSVKVCLWNSDAKLSLDIHRQEGQRILDHHSCKNNKIGKDPNLFDVK